MSETLEFNFIEIEQPVGIMYMGKLSADNIFKISRSNIRTYENQNGIQRHRNEERVRAIAKYCEDSDAIFPTPIILSGDSDYITLDNNTLIIEIEKIIEDKKYLSIVDGQHRIEGIYRSGRSSKFILPVMLILDTTAEQDAYLFSVINGNQQPVSKSLVYDLFNLSSHRTIEKVCNYLVKQLNSDDKSAIKNRIKMLGIKTDDTPNATVSQATIIRNLISYFSNNVNNDNIRLKRGEELEDMDEDVFIFRSFFKNKKDAVIYKILLNYFNAVTFQEEQIFDKESVNYLQKTIGYTAKVFLLRPLYLKGRDNKKLTEDYFKNELEKIFIFYKNRENSSISSKKYSSSDSGAKELYRGFLKYWVMIDEENKKYVNDKELEKINSD